MRSIHFMAYGVPQPKGSARAFVPKGWTRAVVTSDNPKNKGWQQVVASAAQEAIAAESGALMAGPVGLTVDFFLQKPKSAPRSLLAHLKKPDLDKLVRSVKDALTKIVWTDDSQVVTVVARKTFAPEGYSPAAQIQVYEVLAPNIDYPTTGAPRIGEESPAPARKGRNRSADF